MRPILGMMTLLIASTVAAMAAGSPTPFTGTSESLVLVDTERKREVPVEVYLPKQGAVCANQPCGVALLSGGAGIDHKAYSFIASELNERGYLVVSVQHQLASDVPPPEKATIYETRLPVWRRGAENLRFVSRELAAKYPTFDWKHILLIGHSNGGDIAALLTTEHPETVSALVTLDNRRMPIPRLASPKILLIRASDFEADAGVLPSPDEQRKLGIALVKIPGAKHDDMNDAGSPDLKRGILKALQDFLASTQTPTTPAKTADLNAIVGVKAMFRNGRDEILLVFDDRRQAWEVPGTVHQGPLTLRNVMDALAREIGLTYADFQLGGLFTYHNPESGATVVRPYYTARFRDYIEGKSFKDPAKAKWFSLSEAKKAIPYPASVQIVEKLIREPGQVWAGAFEEYGYTSPMTDRGVVKFRVLEDFYLLK